MYNFSNYTNLFLNHKWVFLKVTNCKQYQMNILIPEIICIRILYQMTYLLNMIFLINIKICVNNIINY